VIKKEALGWRFWEGAQRAVDLKGGVWVALFSLAVLKEFWSNQAVPDGQVAMYGLVLGSFAVKKTAQLFKRGKETE
jgi:hypothetical protein